jgi:hypothetical protein
MPCHVGAVLWSYPVGFRDRPMFHHFYLIRLRGLLGSDAKDGLMMMMAEIGVVGSKKSLSRGY